MLATPRSKRLAVIALVLAPMAAVMSFFSAPRAMPKFDDLCTTGRPFSVAAAYRSQTANNRAPDTAAPSVVLFQDSARDTAHYTLATFRDSGAVWGLGYSQAEHAVYASTYHKRGLPYGPSGAGGVYRIDLATGEVKPFVTVPNAGSEQRGANRSDGSFGDDANGARKVGKTALGDLDLNDDGTELYVMNLEARQIYRYAVPDGTLLGHFDHGAAKETWFRDARPFGMAFYNGHLYHGVVNTRGNIEARVYRSNPDGTDMTQVAQFSLRYQRDPIRMRELAGSGVMWAPWNDSVETNHTERPRLHAPQPMLTDIAFTPDGTMTIALRDRYWDITNQWIDVVESTPTAIHGGGAIQPTPVVNIVAEAGLGFGDILRAQAVTDTFKVETNPEHFDDRNAIQEAESAMGGLACVAGSNTVGATSYGVDTASSDKIIGEEGVYWYDVPSGNKTGHESLQHPTSFQPYSRLLSSFQAAWAHGPWSDITYEFDYFRDVGSLGDIETLCGSCQPGVVVPTPDIPTDTPEATDTPEDTPVAPSDTPVAPSDTPTLVPSDTPTSAPPSPTPTATPRDLYLPILLKEKCDPERAQTDAILVMDASESMKGAKLQAAKDAAIGFVHALQLPDDHVGVVAFNDTATVVSRLSGDGTALASAIGQITTAPNTRIDLGLQAAQGLLAGPERRPNSTPVVVLLTDGIQVFDPESAQRLATSLRDAGVSFYVVGLGGDVDVPYLQRLTGDPAHLFLSLGPNELAEILVQITRMIPCPASAFWGAR